MQASTAKPTVRIFPLLRDRACRPFMDESFIFPIRSVSFRKLVMFLIVAFFNLPFPIVTTQVCCGAQAQ
jgi:hypothetical protein